MADPFSGDVGLEDLKKVFQAHGVDVEDVDLEENIDGKIRRTRMIKLQKGDLIDVMRADPVFYRGKAHRLARAYGVPIPDLYQADKFTSAKK
jgi:hypothetical protein